MLKINLHNSPLLLSIFSGLAVFLAFPNYHIVPTILLFPFLFLQLSYQKLSYRKLFLYGFLVSFIIMLGGFYWVTYVLHEFGYMSWSLAIILYLGFCGFGALNFPLFTVAARWLENRYHFSKRNQLAGAWLVLGLPALFTLIEYLIPKLFPWNLGHCLFEQIALIQTADITGSYYFTFCIFSLGAAIGGLFSLPYKISKGWLLFPLFLVVFNCIYGVIKRPALRDNLKQLDVSLIQANIGNFDKVASTKGVESKLDFILNSYFDLTEKALKENPNTQLIIWPETALPFGFQKTNNYSERVWEKVKTWGKPFITGGYALSQDYPPKDYNGAYLLEPQKYPAPSNIYLKNVLLAFGEYMPFGELFPFLYSYFPEVSNFSAGTTQETFIINIPEPIRLGINICYEAIIPSFIRKVANNNPHIFVNLTNDSWFGPTSEPYLHGALTIFRAIEHRVPFIRATNTGTSFIVGIDGAVSRKTPTYEPAFVNQKVSYLANPSPTIYQLLGDWFIGVCILVFLTLFLVGRKNVSLDG